MNGRIVLSLRDCRTRDEARTKFAAWLDATAADRRRARITRLLLAADAGELDDDVDDVVAAFDELDALDRIEALTAFDALLDDDGRAARMAG